MDIVKLKEELEKITDEIICSSNDGNIRGKIDRLLSLKGQLSTPTMHFYEYEENVLDSFIGDNFKVYITKNYAHFMTTGGYHIFCKPSNQSLYGTIKSIIDLSKEYEKSNVEDKENLDTAFSMASYILECPLFAFGRIETTIDLANAIVKTLNDSMDEALNSELDEEDYELNDGFEQAVKTSEKLIEFIPKIEEEFDKVETEKKPKNKRKSTKKDK